MRTVVPILKAGSNKRRATSNFRLQFPAVWSPMGASRTRESMLEEDLRETRARRRRPSRCSAKHEGVARADRTRTRCIA